MISNADFLFDRPDIRDDVRMPVQFHLADRTDTLASRPLTPFGLITLEPLGYLGSPRCRMSVNSPLACLFRIQHHRTQSFRHSVCSVFCRFLARTDLTVACALGCSRDRHGSIKTL